MNVFDTAPVDVFNLVMLPNRGEPTTAQQPAPVGAHQLVARVDAAMVEMQNITPPLKRSECQRLIIAAIDAATPPQRPAPVQEPAAWLPIDAAPKDGSLVLLLVEFEDHATEDGPGPHPTIGSNTSENDEGPDEWQFAGWNWEYDCYTQGVGTPVGWLPMTVLQLKEHQDTAAYLDDLAVDRFAAAMKAKMAKQRARGYGGWHDADACPTKRLQKMLCEHVGKGDPVDVGNIAMMLWTRKEPTTLQAQQLALVQKSECGRYAWVPVKPSTAMLIAGSHCQPGDYSAALVWEEMVACAVRTDYLRPVDPPKTFRPASPAEDAYIELHAERDATVKKMRDIQLELDDIDSRIQLVCTHKWAWNQTAGEGRYCTKCNLLDLSDD